MNERRHLIPADALKRAPKAVKDAQRTAERKLDALGKGRERATKARAGLRAARNADAEAMTRAARGDAEAQQPTEPAAKAELEAAQRGCEILIGDARAAIRELHAKVVEHHRALIDSQVSAVEAAQARAGELLVELGDTLDELAGERAVLLGYRASDDYQDGAIRGRTHTRIGRLNFSNRAQPTWKQALDALRGALSDYVPGSESEGERKDREQAEAEERGKLNRAFREMAGAAVPPGNVTRGY
jgi:hypothetical protein